VRCYLNEYALPDPEVRTAVEIEIEGLLRREGIDMKNKTFTVP
jgi:hypothetical protein